MARFKLTVEYAGTRYSGWQIQKNARTVQGEIDKAVRTVTGRAGFELYGSGRTDAGVHAMAQVAHLDIAGPVAPVQLLRRLNDELPADIAILTIEPVDRRFHARHDAVSRSYLYQITRRKTAFAKPFVWWVKDDLDVNRMREGAALFVGRHDFRSFSDDDPDLKSTLVVLDAVDIEEEDALVLVRVRGSHFIWKMVRRIVGVLVEVGRGMLDPARVARFLRERSDLPARLTAPASGLFLEHVFYRDEPNAPGPSGDRRRGSLPRGRSGRTASPRSG
jgi:tRNA pseudouridine38-40 synthase